MKLVHYSKRPLPPKLRTVRQANDPDFKPYGLWVSDNSTEQTWESWCLSENFQTDNLKVATEVVLAPGAQVLHITTLRQLDEFHSQYAVPLYTGSATFGIDWKAVAAQHHGIVISPYQWRRRLSRQTLWYYGWDCASGCIWDAAAIAALKPLTEAPCSPTR